MLQIFSNCEDKLLKVSIYSCFQNHFIHSWWTHYSLLELFLCEITLLTGFFEKNTVFELNFIVKYGQKNAFFEFSFSVPVRPT